MDKAIDTDSLVIQQTKNWLRTVVIGLGFCPFAGKEMEKESIYYAVVTTSDLTTCLENLILEFERLEQNQDIATSLLIYPKQWCEFDAFLDYLALAESLLEQQGYQGIYQLASFHPSYCFESATDHDAANYTNRSPYPMLHLLREDQVEKTLIQYPHPEQIPQQNIQRARKLGEAALKKMLQDCL